MQLTNNTILITGGTSGIGLAFAQAFLVKGNTVIVTARSQDKLATVLAANPGLIGYTSDVTDSHSVEQLADQVLTNHPDLNIVMNSAGIMRAYDLFAETKPTDLLAEVTTNLNGTILVSQTFLSHLSQMPTALLLNVSSGLANVSSAAHPIYSATKAGVHMFTDAVREQALYHGFNNLHVIELVPPLVAETNLEATTTPDAPNNMRLADLVTTGLDGIAHDVPRIDAGFAAQMHQLAKDDQEGFTHNLALGMLKQHFG